MTVPGGGKESGREPTIRVHEVVPACGHATLGAHFVRARNLASGSGEVVHETVCRMFGPAIGVPEDPVNGSGHGPLGAYLLDRGGAYADAASKGFWSGMGRALGRRGRVWVRVLDGQNVEVGGYVTDFSERDVALR